MRNPPHPQNASRPKKAEMKALESRAEHTSYHYFHEPLYLSEIEYHPLTRPKSDQRLESYNEQGSGERRVQFSQITSDSNPSTKSAGSMEMQQGSAPHVSESFTPPSSTGLGRTRHSYRRLDDSPERNPRTPSTERLTSAANYSPRGKQLSYEESRVRPSSDYYVPDKRIPTPITSPQTPPATQRWRENTPEGDYLVSGQKYFLPSPSATDKTSAAYTRATTPPEIEYSVSGHREAPTTIPHHQTRSHQMENAPYWNDSAVSPSYNPMLYPMKFTKPKKDPPKYKGGKSDVKDFLAQFELIMAYNKWSDEDAGFELASSLEEGARSVISTLPEEKRCDYKSLCQALRNRFQAPGSKRKSAVGIWDRPMQKNEDVFAFVNVLRQWRKKLILEEPSVTQL